MVLPEPISPVITTKPSVNQMVDSMYALARAWCLRQVQELRVRAQPERQLLQLESSRYMRSRCGPVACCGWKRVKLPSWRCKSTALARTQSAASIVDGDSPMLAVNPPSNRCRPVAAAGDGASIVQ